MSFDLADLERRFANMVKVGTIEEVTTKPPRARVRFGKNVSHWLRWTTERACGDRKWWPPKKGEQVIVLSPSGDLTQGIITESIYSDKSPAPSDKEGVDKTEYEDGAVVQYDTNAHKLTATIPGDAEVEAEGNIKATAGDTITLAASNIILAASLIQLAGPLVAKGLSGESYGATFLGNITQKNGDFTNVNGDVIAQLISLLSHTHTEQGDYNETSTSN